MVNSAFFSSGVGKLSSGQVLAEVKERRVRLRLLVGNLFDRIWQVMLLSCDMDFLTTL